MTKRIVSLLPSATEIVFALGAQDQLVGVSHACDYPNEVKSLPCLTKSILTPGLSAREIDQMTAAALRRGESLYELDEKLLRDLRPDVVITQALCDVCAISYSSVERAVGSLGPGVSLVSLEPDCIEAVLNDVVRVGVAIDREQSAHTLVEDAQRRLYLLRTRVDGAPRPRVLGLEWFDPPYFGGHWVPEQIEAAGGTPVIGAPGERSLRMSWQSITELDPDVILLMPCGYNAEESRQLLGDVSERSDWKALRAVQEGRVWSLDANAHFSRPGPRVIAGAELIGHILHPSLVPLSDSAQPYLHV